MTDETTDITNGEREYSLDELSTLADVTPRTVRYYIVEGLLPPPLTTGRNATYSQEHLDRLHAIAAMKEMYLPLREIRHRLNILTPEQMQDPAYLASFAQAVAMDRAGRRSRPHARPHGDHPRSHHDPRSRRSERRGYREESVVPSSQTWDRIPLGEDAELMIRSDKARQMGTKLHRALHKLRHIIETEELDNERNQ